MKASALLVAITVGLVLYWYTQRRIKEHFGETAQDACRQISTRAEEIKAAYNGNAELMNAAWGFLSPNNYKSGDNTSNNMMRNIINVDMRQEDIAKINSSCINSSASNQTNEINTADCPFCHTNRCDISDVTQTNTSESSQMCGIKSAIEILMKKTDSVDAQALARALQEASGQMSGDNTSNNSNCNIVNKDMSSKQYFEHLSSCANRMSVDQRNTIDSCGSVMNVIQSNQSKKLQECVIGVEDRRTTETNSNTVVVGSSFTDQLTKGSVAASLCILCLCLSSSISVALLLSDTGNGGGGRGGSGGGGNAVTLNLLSKAGPKGAAAAALLGAAGAATAPTTPYM